MRKIKPNLVLINYVGNDWEEPNKLQRKDRFNSSSYFLNKIVLSIQILSGLIPESERLEIAPHHFRKKVPEHLGTAYVLISELLKARNIPGLVILDSRYESPMAPHEGVINIIKSLGLIPIDLMKIIRGGWVGPSENNAKFLDRHNLELVIKHDGHPNQKWHTEVTEILFPEIKKLLP